MFKMGQPREEAKLRLSKLRTRAFLVGAIFLLPTAVSAQESSASCSVTLAQDMPVRLPTAPGGREFAERVRKSAAPRATLPLV